MTVCMRKWCRARSVCVTREEQSQSLCSENVGVYNLDFTRLKGMLGLQATTKS